MSSTLAALAVSSIPTPPNVAPDAPITAPIPPGTIQEIEVAKTLTRWRTAGGAVVSRATARFEGASYQFWNVTWEANINRLVLTIVNRGRTSAVNGTGGNAAIPSGTYEYTGLNTSQTNWFGLAQGGKVALFFAADGFRDVLGADGPAITASPAPLAGYVTTVSVSWPLADTAPSDVESVRFVSGAASTTLTGADAMAGTASFSATPGVGSGFHTVTTTYVSGTTSQTAFPWTSKVV